VLLHLAADALEWCGASRADPLAPAGVVRRDLDVHDLTCQRCLLVSSVTAMPPSALTPSGRRKLAYPKWSLPKPSRSATGLAWTVPCTGYLPARTARPIFSGPAHSVAGSPPSRASAATAPLREASASSRSARYRLDFPLPFGPVTTFRSVSGTTSRRSDR
jgi:hypothetical protein